MLEIIYIICSIVYGLFITLTIVLPDKYLMSKSSPTAKRIGAIALGLYMLLAWYLIMGFQL